MRESPWEASVPWEEVSHGRRCPREGDPREGGPSGESVPGRGSQMSGVILTFWMVNGLTFFGEGGASSLTFLFWKEDGVQITAFPKTRTNPPKPKPRTFNTKNFQRETLKRNSI